MKLIHGESARALLALPPDQIIPGCRVIPAKAVRCVQPLWGRYQGAWIKCGLDADEFESVCLSAICVWADRKYDKRKGCKPWVYAGTYARYKVLERMKQAVGETWRPTHALRVDFLSRMLPLYVKDNAGGPEHLRAEIPAVDPPEDTEIESGGFPKLAHAAGLTDREIEVVRARVFEGKSFTDIRDAWGVTRQRVCQVYDRAIRRLRLHCSSERVLAEV